MIIYIKLGMTLNENVLYLIKITNTKKIKEIYNVQKNSVLTLKVNKFKK